MILCSTESFHFEQKCIAPAPVAKTAHLLELSVCRKGKPVVLACDFINTKTHLLYEITSICLVFCCFSVVCVGITCIIVIDFSLPLICISRSMDSEQYLIDIVLYFFGWNLSFITCTLFEAVCLSRI